MSLFSSISYLFLQEKWSRAKTTRKQQKTQRKMEADTGVKQREEGLDGKDEEGERDDYPHALVNFLRRDGLGSLQQRYAITAAHHKRYPNLVCLKYNQV
jgi:hypothetical protein